MQKHKDTLSVVVFRFLWTRLPRVYTALCRVRAAVNVLLGRPTVANLRSVGEMIRVPPGNARDLVITGCVVTDAPGGVTLSIGA